ncbi:MAG: glycoside hydrolase family 73 protein [Sphingobacteriaceae bacterium]|jgi:hypothetical protein
MRKVKYLYLSDHKFHILSIICLFVFITDLSFAQSNQEKVKKYITDHSEKAVEQMILFKIPASVILAQAIKESGYGNSTLAKETNNHFGIKCHKEWGGDSYTMDDDSTNECFRSYKSVDDSYYDHSMFLASRPRYDFLFKNSITDYVSWCIGLKKAGYATDPHYTNELLYIIEVYNLHELDKITPLKKSLNYSELLASQEKNIISTEENYFTNAEKHILANVIFNITTNEEPLLVRGNSTEKNID